MLAAIRAPMTYANVAATGAMFVALDGGAYALSVVPARGGVYGDAHRTCVASWQVVSDRSEAFEAVRLRE